QMRYLLKCLWNSLAKLRLGLFQGIRMCFAEVRSLWDSSVNRRPAYWTVSGTSSTSGLPPRHSLMRFQVVSGCAPAFAKAHFEKAVFPGTTSFHSMVNHEQVLRTAVLRFLRSRASHPLNEGRIQVAVLGESNTGFGARARRPAKSSDGQKPNAECN